MQIFRTVGKRMTGAFVSMLASLELNVPLWTDEDSLFHNDFSNGQKTKIKNEEGL